MDFVEINCPECGFSKRVERSKIPANVKTIKCPQCTHQFPFGQDSEPDDFLFEQTAAAPEAPVQQAGPPPVAPQSKFCATCGNKIHVNAEICPKCGVRVAAPANAINKVALLLITFFLGGIGGHKFYVKKYGLGVLYLLFFWTYIPTLVALVEFIIYACKSEAELQQKYPQGGGSGALIAVVLLVPVSIAIVGILAAIAIPQFAAYREKAYSSAAKSALKNCRVKAEVYFAEVQSYPVEPSQLQCATSNNVAVYYLSYGPMEYQLVSFHKQGQSAFISSSNSSDIAKEKRNEIEAELTETYGPGVLGAEFHFMQ